jgi:CBS domain-containing protein
MAIRHGQSDFPVLVGGRVVGLLTRHDLTRGLAVDGASRSVGECMNHTFETVDGAEPLVAIFDRWAQEPDKTLLVIDRGQLVGLVGLDQVTNLLRFKHNIDGPDTQTTTAGLRTGIRL